MCFEECLIDFLAVTNFCCGFPSIVNMSLSIVIAKPRFKRHVIICRNTLPRFDWLPFHAYDDYWCHYWNHLQKYIREARATRPKPRRVFYTRPAVSYKDYLVFYYPEAV